MQAIAQRVSAVENAVPMCRCTTCSADRLEIGVEDCMLCSLACFAHDDAGGCKTLQPDHMGSCQNDRWPGMLCQQIWWTSFNLDRQLRRQEHSPGLSVMPQGI